MWTHKLYTYIFSLFIAIPYILIFYFYLKFIRPTVNTNLIKLSQYYGYETTNYIALFIEFSTIGLFILIIVLIFAWEYISTHKEILNQIKSKEINKNEQEELYTYVNSLSKDFGIKTPTLHIADLGQPNAFATGRKNNGHIIISIQLIKILNPDEIKSVIAHEMSHIESRDILPLLIWKYHMKKIQLVKGIILQILLSPLPEKNSKIISNILIKISTKLFSIILLYPLLRMREIQADKDSKEHTNGKNLATALNKISHTGKDQQNQNISNSLMIYNKSNINYFDKYTSTHPKIETRIEKLLY